MDKRTPILIREVGNGFTVDTGYTGRSNAVACDSDLMVFETIQRLQQFIAEHFEKTRFDDKLDVH